MKLPVVSRRYIACEMPIWKTGLLFSLYLHAAGLPYTRLFLVGVGGFLWLFYFSKLRATVGVSPWK